MSSPSNEGAAEVTTTTQKPEKKVVISRYVSVEHLDVRRESHTPHTLEQYASTYFRQLDSSHAASSGGGGRSIRRTFSGQLQRRNQGSSKSQLWKFSLDPIKSPLLKTSCQLSESLQHKACQSFKNIMKYMGNYPTKRTQSSTISLTDRIFQPPLIHSGLRDEVYCQIVKQITQNRTRTSEERGWELLWLLTGLFPPNDLLLLNEIEFFISSHKENNYLVNEIEKRLSTLSQLSYYRMCPPYVSEVDVVQKKVYKMFQKIILPDDSCQVIEVDSFMTVHQVCLQIGSLLNLQSIEGFGILIALDNDDVIAVEDNNSYFLDFLQESTKHVDPQSLLNDADDFYQVIFLKTHLVNMLVEQDTQADIHFHYYQELTKYLCGHYKVTLEDAIQIGSYIYRAKFGSDPFHMDSINDIVLDLVPRTVWEDDKTIIDWESVILTKYRQHSITSSEEAKFCVLKYLSRWSTFASHFFQVTQHHKLAGILTWTLCLNQGHLLIINSNHEVIDIHLLSSIVSWSYSSKGNLLKLCFDSGNILSFETPLYYEISQLLVYYSNYASINKDQIHTKHRISIICDSIA